MPGMRFGDIDNIDPVLTKMRVHDGKDNADDVNVGCGLTNMHYGGSSRHDGERVNGKSHRRNWGSTKASNGHIIIDTEEDDAIINRSKTRRDYLAQSLREIDEEVIRRTDMKALLGIGVRGANVGGGGGGSIRGEGGDGGDAGSGVMSGMEHRGASLRTRRLWNFNDERDEQITDREGGDDGDGALESRAVVHDTVSATTSDHRHSSSNNECNSNEGGNAKPKLWSAKDIRREMRQTLAKQVKNDLLEMEEFSMGMKQRIANYSTTETREKGGRVDDDDGVKRREVDGENRLDVGTSEEQKQRERDVDSKNSSRVKNLIRGIRNVVEEESRTLTQTISSDGQSMDIPMTSNATPSKSMASTAKATPMDDGYGKQMVAGRTPFSRNALNNDDVDGMIHKFQSSRINQTIQRGMTKQVQAAKIATYCGINKSCDEYVSTATPNNNLAGAPTSCVSPREMRLQRLRDLNKQTYDLDALQEEYGDRKAVDVVEERKEELSGEHGQESSGDRLDSWWNDQKGNDNKESNRVDNWWKLQRHKKEFDELNGVQQKGKKYDALSGEPISANNSAEGIMSPASYREKRKLMDSAPSLPTLQTPVSLLSFKSPRSKPISATNEEDKVTSINDRRRPKSPPPHNRFQSPPKRFSRSSRTRDQPPTPEGGGTVSSRYSQEAKEDTLATPSPSRNFGRKAFTSPGSYTRPPRNSLSITPSNYFNEETTPRPSSSASVVSSVYINRHKEKDQYSDSASVKSALSDIDDTTAHHSQYSQSVAQSTLQIILHRLDDAKVHFEKALVENDVKNQSELAGLITRLGEAAVVMKKLEQS